MQLFDSIEEIRAILEEKKQEGLSIGLVPTMGALHEGHMSLIKKAQTCDVVVVSIFVNALQFNNKNDLTNYPRSLEDDLLKLKNQCDIVFAPSHEAIYGSLPVTQINFGRIGSRLEGEFRPGHFEGVGLIVAKFFNIIQPDYAYFGLKDLQQFLLIKQLVSDLSFPIEIVGCQTIREACGLAMSSRNQKLSERGREVASKIFQGLNTVKKEFEQGISLKESKRLALQFYAGVDGLEVEYLEYVSPQLDVLDEFGGTGGINVCIAASVEGIRLIDNLYLQSQN